MLLISCFPILRRICTDKKRRGTLYKDCLNCKISIVFSLAVSMVGTVSLSISVVIGVLTYIIMKGNKMSSLTMIYSIIGGVLVLVGLLVQTAPTMIRYGD